MDPFTQVKLAKHMVKSKAKAISNRGSFSSFYKNGTSARPQFTERWIDNFPKITAWNWSGSHLFCYRTWAQRMSANFQNTHAFTYRTGLYSMKLVWLIQIAEWSPNQRILKISENRSDSAGSVCLFKPEKGVVMCSKVDNHLQEETILS